MFYDSIKSMALSVNLACRRFYGILEGLFYVMMNHQLSLLLKEKRFCLMVRSNRQNT